MPVNELSFNQVSVLLGHIVQQATGEKVLAATNTRNFVTQAQTALKVGYDPLMNAISQVLSRTLFAVRKYDTRFKGLRADSFRWGNHVRKINYLDTDAVDYTPLTLDDGASVDQWKVRKPQVVQTNFYGFNAWDDYITIFTTQLDTAFTTPDEFQRFISGLLVEIANKHAQYRENLARMTVVNMIGGRIAEAGEAGSPMVVHLVSEYRKKMGIATDVPDSAIDYKSLISWIFGYIRTLSDFMEERTTQYHTNIAGKEAFMRHTPKANQKLYLLSGENNYIDTMVRANTYNADYLKMLDFETVNFWQSIKTPDAINVTANYMGTDGAIKTGAAAKEKIFGVLFDEEACGYTVMEEKMLATPHNAAGDFHNLWWHSKYKYWNDSSENSIVLMLD